MIETARHVAELTAECVDGRDESVSGSLSEKIYDLIETATSYSVSITQKGRHVAAVVIWDTE